MSYSLGNIVLLEAIDNAVIGLEIKSAIVLDYSFMCFTSNMNLERDLDHLANYKVWNFSFFSRVTFEDTFNLFRSQIE